MLNPDDPILVLTGPYCNLHGKILRVTDCGYEVVVQITSRTKHRVSLPSNAVQICAQPPPVKTTGDYEALRQALLRLDDKTRPAVQRKQFVPTPNPEHVEAFLALLLRQGKPMTSKQILGGTRALKRAAVRMAGTSDQRKLSQCLRLVSETDAYSIELTREECSNGYGAYMWNARLKKPSEPIVKLEIVQAMVENA